MNGLDSWLPDEGRQSMLATSYWDVLSGSIWYTVFTVLGCVSVYIQDTLLAARGEYKQNSLDLLPKKVSAGHILTLEYSICHVESASYGGKNVNYKL
jgi:hypothetical protein